MVHVVLAAGNGLNSSAFAGFDLSALRSLREVRSGTRMAGCARASHGRSLARGCRCGRRGIPQHGRAAAAHSKGPSFSRPHINSSGRARIARPGLTAAARTQVRVTEGACGGGAGGTLLHYVAAVLRASHPAALARLVAADAGSMTAAAEAGVRGLQRLEATLPRLQARRPPPQHSISLFRLSSGLSDGLAVHGR